MQSGDSQTAGQNACSAEKFATSWILERQTIYVAVHRTVIARMFISLGLADDIVNVIVGKQGYNTLPSFNHLNK